MVEFVEIVELVAVMELLEKTDCVEIIEFVSFVTTQASQSSVIVCLFVCLFVFFFVFLQKNTVQRFWVDKSKVTLLGFFLKRHKCIDLIIAIVFKHIELCFVCIINAYQSIFKFVFRMLKGLLRFQDDFMTRMF